MKLGSQKPETLQILGCVTRDKTQKMVDLGGGFTIYIYIQISGLFFGVIYIYIYMYIYICMFF